MPTKPSAKSAKRFPVILIVFAALILLSIGGLFGWTIYHGREVSADKARFAQAEKDIDELSKSVVAAVGTPASTKTEKFCSRPHLEFEKGPLSCDIHWTGYYPVSTIGQANQLYQSTKNLPSGLWEGVQHSSLDGKSSNNFSGLFNNKNPSEDKVERMNATAILHNGMKCSMLEALYLATDPPYTDYPKMDSGFVLAVDLTCGDEAKIEHYTLKP